MKRLEYVRRIRSVPCRGRTTAEAVMFLAQVTRERQRLQQERRGLEQRLSRIEARLDLLGQAETRLVPAIQSGIASAPGPGAPAAPAARATAGSGGGKTSGCLPAGVMEVTLQY